MLYDEQLYRALDKLLPHKEALEEHLKQRLGELFAVEYDLLLYDLTSTYFEGEEQYNPLAQRGYSRDHRPDCKQVNIALIVTREGIPLGHEVFAGNVADVKTLKQIVESVERRYFDHFFLGLNGISAGAGLTEQQQATAGRFPESLILSHDLVESGYARSALVSDVDDLEEQPDVVTLITLPRRPPGVSAPKPSASSPN